MKKTFLFLIFAMLFSFSVSAQTSSNKNEKDKQKGGVIFKIPEDVFPMDWKKSGFKGILMLRKDSPSGIFISYPDENEKIEALRERAARFIAPMFIKDEKEEKNPVFEQSSIPNHKGDSGDSGLYYSYKNDKTLVQILFYERTANGMSFIYGYFAMKNVDAKPESVKDIWADEKGQGVKIFEKFWKTLDE